ncbi:MAG: UDP-N-acetylmuramoyl-L-alanine--D-glutamate ligase [Clostridia bacterium]|nr:UDP-N-acetylmuramoyl-L-alanine--D-glutamate ligase [Clostridia bacterium]
MREGDTVTRNPKLEEFRNQVAGKTATVVGLGISNLPVIDFLLSCGMTVTGRDLKNDDKMKSISSDLARKGVNTFLGEHYLEDIRDDYIFKAPGIRGDLPPFRAAVENGSVLTSEMQVFFDLCPASIFAVTGSDGKTTTTTLIYTFLSEQFKRSGSGNRVFVGGNIGKPLLPVIEEIRENDAVVLELSSFQLHAMRSSPHVACITNVTPNHLNWHTGMEEYIDSKKTIYRHQTRLDRLVLNADNPVTYSMASEAQGHVTLFSSSRTPSENDPCDAFLYLDNSVISLWNREDPVPYPVLDTKDIFIPGRHNVENYMTAIGAVRGWVDPETILSVAKTFRGVEHREEFVCEKQGIRFYNSSIDSSPTRTIAALNAFPQKLIVILGGYDKHIPFDALCEPLAVHAKGIVYTGATRDLIRNTLESSPVFRKAGIPSVTEPDFFAAIDAAKGMAEPGDIVILSPACASFDSFANFEERGKAFKQHVLSYTD